MAKKQIVRSYLNNGQRLWEVNFQLQSIRVRRRGYISKQEALIVATRIRADILTGNFQVASLRGDRNITLNQFNEKYYMPQRMTEVKASTIATEKNAYSAWLKGSLGPLRLIDIDSAAIARWTFKKSQQGYSKHTINNQITYLQSRLKMAHKLGYIKEMPTIERVKVTKRIKACLTPQQVFAFVDYFNEEKTHHYNQQYANLTAFLFYTGCRIGEACALKWSDINLDEATVTINKRVYRGKIDTPKNGKSNLVPIHPELIKYIKSQYEITADNENNDVFLSKSHRSYLKPNTYQLAFKRAAKRLLEDTKDISPHALRRSLATALISNKVPVNQAAAILNHNADVLINSYATADMEKFRETFANMNFDGSRAELRTLKVVKSGKVASSDEDAA